MVVKTIIELDWVTPSFEQQALGVQIGPIRRGSRNILIGDNFLPYFVILYLIDMDWPRSGIRNSKVADGGRDTMNDDSTKQRILLASGPIFADNGFRGATVRDISVKANVNLASINYYFGDKKKLYVETVKAARKMRLEAFPSPQPNPTLAPDQQLEAFIRLLLNRLVAGKSAPWQVKLLVREFMQPTEECRDLIEDFIKPVFRVLLNIVDQLVENSPPKTSVGENWFEYHWTMSALSMRKRDLTRFH